MIFWLLMVLLALHIVGAFFMTPPTAMADRFFNAVARHPKVREEHVSSVSINHVELNDADRAQFVQAFNEANFLYEGGIVQDRNDAPVLVELTQKKIRFTFKMYLYGDNMVEVIRYKGQKHLPYRLRAEALESFLLWHASSPLNHAE